MRVLVQTPEPADGAAQYVTALVRALAESKLPVMLLCPSNFAYRSEVTQGGAHIITTGERPVSHASIAVRVARNLRFLALTVAKQLMTTCRGDVVHFQFPLHLPAGMLFFWIAKLKGGCLVLTVHDPVPHRPYSAAWRRFLDFRLKKMSYGMVGRLIVHNQAGKDILVAHFGQSADRITVIPHGPFFNLSRECPVPTSSELKLLLFGAIRENKGVKLAIEAVQKLNSEGVYRTRLTIAGTLDNPLEQGYWEECKALIRRSPHWIDLHEGFVPDQKLANLFGQHHAIVLPYTHFQSESGVATLALCCERPIIATSEGGLGELLDDVQCGVKIRAATVESVMDAISTAHKHGAGELLRMGRNGASYVSEFRSWAAIARKTLDCYSQLTLINSSVGCGGQLCTRFEDRALAPEPAQERPTTAPCSQSQTREI